MKCAVSAKFIGAKFVGAKFVEAKASQHTKH